MATSLRDYCQHLNTTIYLLQEREKKKYEANVKKIIVISLTFRLSINCLCNIIKCGCYSQFFSFLRVDVVWITTDHRLVAKIKLHIVRNNLYL